MADQVGIGPSAVLSSFLVLLGQTCVAIGVEACSFVIVLLGYCIQRYSGSLSRCILIPVPPHPSGESIA